jgi:hypothetical protein
MTRALDSWYDTAGVRVAQRRLLEEDREAGLAPFPAALVPYLGHPALADLDPADRKALLARHLYQYLLYTVHLETKVVNRGVALIGHGELGFPVRPQLQLDAFKIYCDEGYHALYSLDIVRQTELATGVPALPYDFGPRLRRLDRAGDRFLPDHPELARLLQVITFETVVTSILADIPRDPTVYRVVREVVADHARDEAYHHAFFVSFFRELWANLPPALRVAAARGIPHLVSGCLRPDLVPLQAALQAAGVAAPLARDILADSYSRPAVTAMIRSAGRHTLRLCESVGAFDLPGGRDALAELGLAG